ncbi:glycosyltransferase family 2 protein [bacterium]|nr:glycosyltransferase family 2 protein [bacterium]
MIDVSILIPCYNAEQWVRQAVESALKQSYGRCEVICVDDGSTDGTLDVLLSFGNTIRVETGPNRGGNVTRNCLLKLATGDWIQYLDADDYLEPTKIEGHVKTLEQGSDADVLFGPVTIERTLPSGEVDRFLDEIPANEDPWNLYLRWGLPQTGRLLWKSCRAREVAGDGCGRCFCPLFLSREFCLGRSGFSPVGCPSCAQQSC